MERCNTSKEFEKELSKHKIKCKRCGHVIMFPNSCKRNKILCRWCGYYVYKNDKEEFKEMLLKKQKEEGYV